MPATARRIARIALILAASACGGETAEVSSPAETWGFVATLGDDTTSVERITRQGDRIVGDAIGRSPTLVRRRWEATLGPDGSVQRWTMDTHVPNAPEGERDLHHELELQGSAIRLVRHEGADSSDRSVRSPYDVTVPWNAFLYATYEMLFNAARDVPDSTRVGVYFFEGWAEGTFGWAELRRHADGRISIGSSGLSGFGVARIDEQGRMTSYSGQGTTYKQEVRRVEDVPDLDALFERFAADERARGSARALSARDTTRAMVGRASVAVDYSRPLARGRTLVGGLIPYDRVWRTGANAATQLIVDAPIRLAGVALDAGTYTLWTLPTRDDVQLIINRESGQWGTGYRESNDIARVPMETATLEAPVDSFTIRVDPTASRLVMEWGTFRWSAPIAPR